MRLNLVWDDWESVWLSRDRDHVSWDTASWLQELPSKSQTCCRWGSGEGACSLCLHTLSCLICSYSVRCGAWADGHVLVELASTRDIGFFMLLCWLYPVPGEADHNGSSFSPRIKLQPCFPHQGVWGRAREDSMGESRKWQADRIESGMCWSVLMESQWSFSLQLLFGLKTLNAA